MVTPKFAKLLAPRWHGHLARSFFLLIIAAQPALALEEAIGHVELNPTFSVIGGSWQWPTFWLDDDLNERTDPAETLVFYGIDDSSELGSRFARPEDPAWDFLGMAAGETVWLFHETTYCSAGFASTQPELSGDLKIMLDGVNGPAGGHFSMFSGSTPEVHMQTLDGISPDDVFPKPDHHSHVTWAFSRKGLWIVRLKAQGTLTSSGNLTPLSPATRLVFAIGDYARWKAASFDLSALENPAISGDAADPDGDGVCNLLEYALRENPRLLPPATAGAPWKITFYRRKDATELSYEIESSSTLTATSWTPETQTPEAVSDDGTWQLVSVSLPAAPPKCFFRLKVSVK